MDMLTPDDGKVFFNTDQTYETRLYNIDTQWTGFYVVNMKIPLECIFKNQKIYVKGNSPLPCQKVAEIFQHKTSIKSSFLGSDQAKSHVSDRHNENYVAAGFVPHNRGIGELGFGIWSPVCLETTAKLQH